MFGDMARPQNPSYLFVFIPPQTWHGFRRKFGESVEILVEKGGEPGGDRTHDHLIKSQRLVRFFGLFFDRAMFVPVPNTPDAAAIASWTRRLAAPCV